MKWIFDNSIYLNEEVEKGNASHNSIIYSFLKADLLIYKVDILFKYQKQNFKCITSTLLYISLNGANGVR